jgi:rhodanese-related sulfurtransferase
MKELKRLPLEAMLVLAVGVGIGLAGNRLNSDGLTLSRDYFPRTAPVAPTQPPPSPTNGDGDGRMLNGATPGARNAVAPTPDAGESITIQRLHQHGLQIISDADVFAAFEDPSRAEGLIVFIDARNDHLYAEGHIPGAYQFDHYYMERYLDQVLPAIFVAEKVIVYCGGGDCEDSEFASVELLRQGADNTRLFVYPGGLAEWKRNGRPVEKGARDSGFIVGEEG